MGKITRLKKKRIEPIERRLDALEEEAKVMRRLLASLCDKKLERGLKPLDALTHVLNDEEALTPPAPEEKPSAKECAEVLKILPPVMTGEEIKDACKEHGEASVPDMSPKPLKEKPDVTDEKRSTKKVPAQSKAKTRRKVRSKNIKGKEAAEKGEEK